MSKITTDEIEVVNIVGSGDLGVELDLTTLVEDLTAVFLSYTPEQFPGIQIEFEEGLPTCNVFSSGKYTIVGAKSQNKLYAAQGRLIEELSELGILDTDFFDEDFDIRNIVCTYDIEKELELSTVSIKLGLENVEYEPEQSPFIVYKPEGEGVTITIPANGRIMITGIIHKDTAVTAVRQLLYELGINHD